MTIGHHHFCSKWYTSAHAMTSLHGGAASRLKSTTHPHLLAALFNLELIILSNCVDAFHWLCFLRAESLSEVLNFRGWPATYISGSLEQQDRMAAMKSLKQMTCRVLISTDLVSAARIIKAPDAPYRIGEMDGNRIKSINVRFPYGYDSKHILCVR